MSVDIGSVKTYLKEIFKLYPKRRELKRVAFTANYSDLTNKPSFEEVPTSVVDFCDDVLTTLDHGGQLKFHYKAGDVTSKITELNKKLEIDTEDTTLTGELNVDGTSYLTGIDNSGVSYLKGNVEVTGTVVSTGSITTQSSLSVGTTASVGSTLTSTDIVNSNSITSKTVTATEKMTSPLFDGLAVKTKWDDLAEIYKSDKVYSAGTLIQFGGKEEITLARTEANGVVSEHPGHLLNSQEEGLPVALCGRVKVLIRGKVNKFDKISLGAHGVGIVSDKCPIARALENKDDDGEGLVLCVTQFRI